MHASTIVAFLTATVSFASAAALPGGPSCSGGSSGGNGGSYGGKGGSSGGKGGSPSGKCGETQVVACCNANYEGDHPVGGNCNSSPIQSLLGTLLNNNCGDNTAFCCDTEQNGLINIALPCIPINLIL